MLKSVNRMLICGIVLIFGGIALFIYSLATYSEVNTLYDKINFDDLDNNKQVPTSEKYYKYLSVSDFLNEKLVKNKNLPLKKTSCIYLDYAQHNTISLYKLIYNGERNDASRREVVEGNVRSLYDTLGSYAGCKKTVEYKVELNKILDEIKKSNDLYQESEAELNSLINGNQIQRQADYQAEQENLSPKDGEIIMQDSYSGEDDEYVPLPDKTKNKSEYEVSGSYQ